MNNNTKFLIDFIELHIDTTILQLDPTTWIFETTNKKCYTLNMDDSENKNIIITDRNQDKKGCFTNEVLIESSNTNDIIKFIKELNKNKYQKNSLITTLEIIIKENKDKDCTVIIVCNGEFLSNESSNKIDMGFKKDYKIQSIIEYTHHNINYKIIELDKNTQWI